jgi:hypothetical protein
LCVAFSRLLVRQVLAPKSSQTSIASEVVAISPSSPVFLGCGPSYEVPPLPGAKLEANLLLIQDSSGALALWVGIDALYAGPALQRELNLFCREEFSLVTIAASHSHNAPMLDHTKPQLGKVSTIHLNNVVDSLKAGITRLLKAERTAVSVRTTTYEVTGVHRRRVRAPFFVSDGRLHIWKDHLRLDPRIPVQITARVLGFYSRENLVAVVWVFPCHPVGYYREGEMSADYVQYARSALRTKFGSQIPFLFLQGASGELNPPFSETGYTSALPIRRLRVAIGRRIRRATESEYETWVDAVTASFLGAIANLANQKMEDYPISFGEMELEMSDFFKSSVLGSERKISLVWLEIAGFRLFAISAEPTWAFRCELFSELTGNAHDGGLELVGCINDTFGYLSSSKQSERGGYEVEGFLRHFDLLRLKGAKHLIREIKDSAKKIPRLD